MPWLKKKNWLKYLPVKRFMEHVFQIMRLLTSILTALISYYFFVLGGCFYHFRVKKGGSQACKQSGATISFS